MRIYIIYTSFGTVCSNLRVHLERRDGTNNKLACLFPRSFRTKNFLFSPQHTQSQLKTTNTTTGELTIKP